MTRDSQLQCADRGEAANHGLTDVGHLARQLKLWYGGAITRKEALVDYEKEMVKRGREAVLLNRQACLDAHDIRRMSPDSPMINRGKARPVRSITYAGAVELC